jgi:hypothetical protein
LSHHTITIIIYKNGGFIRKVVLYIAMTMDGMISDSNDGIFFLDSYGELKWVVDKTNAIISNRHDIDG